MPFHSSGLTNCSSFFIALRWISGESSGSIIVPVLTGLIIIGNYQLIIIILILLTTSKNNNARTFPPERLVRLLAVSKIGCSSSLKIVIEGRRKLRRSKVVSMHVCGKSLTNVYKILCCYCFFLLLFYGQVSPWYLNILLAARRLTSQ